MSQPIPAERRVAACFQENAERENSGKDRRGPGALGGRFLGRAPRVESWHENLGNLLVLPPLLTNVYRFRIRCNVCELLFGGVGGLGQDRSSCLSVCCI
jgi:hypothetical protein